MNKNRIVLLSMTAVCLTLLCAFLFTGRAEASPAAPDELALTQPDGITTFAALQWGDEWNNGIETIEGYSILQTADGWWVYADLQPDGLLAPALVDGSQRRVGIDAPDGLPLHLRSTITVDNPNSLLAILGEKGIDPSDPADPIENPDGSQKRDLVVPAPDSPEAPELTNVKTLLLLAEFSDTAHNPLYTAASFQSLMFSTTSSSVRKYFRETSYNKMDIVPAAESCGTANDGTTNWTNLGYNHPNPGSATGLSNQQIVKDVLNANNGCINFASFDTNGNGYINSNELIIIVVVAGYERAYMASSPSVWAHQWNLNGVGAPTLDGKVVSYYPYGGYAQFGERHGTHQATIGIMAHEFGHAINWPDLYDTDGSSEGVGSWSIMGAGNWNGIVQAGDSPAHADAWLKWYQGWLAPSSVSWTLNNVSIPRAEDHATAYLLRSNPGGVDWKFSNYSGTGEFFLVENRQKVLYDSGLPGCGLLIWHIDESVTSTNSANASESDPLVKLIEADGFNDLYWGSNRGDTGDPYPGSSSNYNFNSATTPNSNLYSGTASQVSVHVDSTACGSTMQADLTYSGGISFSKFSYLPMIKKIPVSTASTTIPNGNFESGAVTWTIYSEHHYPVIVNSFTPTGVAMHGGSWGAWLGGVYSDTKYIKQNVTVPSGAPYVVFYQYAASADYCGYDFANVYVNYTSVYSKILCVTNNTGGWVRTSLNLSSYAGQNISLQFIVDTDSSYNSNWFLDDITFSATAAPPFEDVLSFPDHLLDILTQE